MAKTVKKEPEVVFHGAHLSAAEKAKGVSYTYDWGKVTDPAHLKIRNDALLKAQNEANAEIETPAEVPAETKA